MSRHPGFVTGFASLLVSVGAVLADPTAEMAPQPQVSFTRGLYNTWNLDWQGVAGRTYLMQKSPDLVNWTYFPFTDDGLGTKSYGTTWSADKYFVRLECSDETPDLAKTTHWEPPLLLVAGPWKVLARLKSGDPAIGVRLTFCRWPAGAATPQSTPLLTATTVADGTYTFSPETLDTGDRVEVRITGSPNQRVYLPWRNGSEAADANITCGGSGLSLAGLLESLGTGHVPDYTQPAGGGTEPLPADPAEAESRPIYRFEDFLKVSKGESDVTYPIGGRQVVREHLDSSGNLLSTPRDTPEDETYWEYPFDLGYGIVLMGPENQEYLFSDTRYEARLSADFSDPDLGITVQRNIFVLKVPLGGELINSCADTASHIAIDPFTFKNGDVCDLGHASLPYDWTDHDYPPVGSEVYTRRLVLGPVPMYVPESVLCGGDFHYGNIKDVRLNAELPLGCKLSSNLSDLYGNNTYYGLPRMIKWTATVTGTSDCDVKITDELWQTSTLGQTGTLTSAATNPQVSLSFHSKLPAETVFDKDFSVTVSAEVMVPTAQYLGIATLYQSTYLGSFATDFKYAVAGDPGGESSPPTVAKRQAAELHGRTGDTPEGDGFNGGQRYKTLEPERRIGVNGLPAPSSPTFVDALTGRFHHSEADFSLNVPGSDLLLAVERSVTDCVWTDAFGLRLTEDPLLVFGPGWNSNLAGSLVRVRSLMPDGSEAAAPAGNPRLLKSNITVRDYQGRAFAFLQYTGGDGNTTFIADPTMLPERGTAGITLAQDVNENLVLTQPLPGLTHVYETTSVDFRIPNNRDTVTDGSSNESGFTGYQYYRLKSVTDRFGETLNYSYGSNPANLIPDVISVAGRAQLQLRFQQSGGRIQAFWDPSGIKHTYTYENRNLAASGQSAASFSILASHQVGPLTAASYGYKYMVEADPRPPSMLLQTTVSTIAYTIPTCHISPNSIANGAGNTLTIGYKLSDVRHSYSTSGKEYYHPAGDPLLVESILLPNQREVAFDLQHTLKNGRPAIPASGQTSAVDAIPSVLSIVTRVTDMWENDWTYSYSTPTSYAWSIPYEDAAFLPSASALFFPQMTRSCSQVADSEVAFTYDPSAGFALSKTTDAANRKSTAVYNETFAHPGGFYFRPVVSTGSRIHANFTLPCTTTDILDHATTYHYIANPGLVDDHLPDIIADSSGRTIVMHRDSLARTEYIQLMSGTNVLAKVVYSYDPTLHGAVTGITREAIGGAGDPSWVTDLVTDIHLDAYGFPARIGNDDANLLTTITRSPAGRVLSVQAPNGGVRSNIHDSSGLLEATYLEDGSNRTYQHDQAGRTVLTRDALGHASGVVYDSMGRVTTAVRDMNGDLGYSSSGGFSGLDAGTDIVSSAAYPEGAHEVRLTDPRGYITVRIHDALGRPTKIITPRNDRAPGIVPTLESDYVTSFSYDNLQSPTRPVSITDPLGYETIFKFDDFARLQQTLRQYGTEGDDTLYSGTTYGFDDATGLPDSITITRTPLNSEGDPIDANTTIQQLTSSIAYDPLGRPTASTFAASTDREASTDGEIRTRDYYTSTGIRYKNEIRDAIAQEGIPEHWCTRETICDDFGRPIEQRLPVVTDALTNSAATPFTDIVYDAYGQIEKLGDAYGNVISLGYDVSGRVSHKKSPAVEDAKSGETLEPVTIYHYDAAGQLARMVDPRGYAWAYERDAAGRLRKTTGPVVSPASPAGHRQPVWENIHDLAGNLTQTIDPEGHCVTRTYYPGGLLSSTITPVTFATSDESPTDVVEQYQRDALGHITRVMDGGNHATAFTYDGLGRTLTATRDPDDDRSKTAATTYDALLPVTTVDARNQHKEYLYDDQFRLAHLNTLDNTGECLSFLYDLLGRVTNIDRPGLTDTTMGDPDIARSYDVLGRLHTETSNEITSTYGYDLLGRVATITNDANTRALAIQHDAAGRTSRVVDVLNGATLTTTFGHDLAGNPVKEDMSNGMAQVSDFDPIGRVTSQSIRNAANTGTLCRTEYEYDLLSNVTEIRESASGSNVPDRHISNTYNERSQLLREIQTESGGSLGAETHGRTETHRYDAAENRVLTEAVVSINDTTASTISRILEYGCLANSTNSNQLYQLIETPDANVPVVTTYSYDGNGNRIGKLKGGISDIYAYDSFDRLTRLDLNTSYSESATYRYAYDPLTRRIARKAGTNPVHYFAFNGSTPVHEWDAAINNGSLVDNIGSGVGGGLYSQSYWGDTSYPFHNARGDVTARFSSGGTMTWHGTYSANGLIQQQTGTRLGNYGANGKWEEPDCLLNDGFRYRDRDTSTFLTSDPAGFIDGLNTYNYVRHNPWSAWDPNGLSTVLLPDPCDTKGIGYYINSTSEIINVGLPADPMPKGNPTIDIDGPEIELSLDDQSGFTGCLSGNCKPGTEVASINAAFDASWILNASFAPLSEVDAAAADYGNGLTESQRATLRQISQSRSDNANNYEILAGTLTGLSFMVGWEGEVTGAANLVIRGLEMGNGGRHVIRGTKMLDEAFAGAANKAMKLPSSDVRLAGSGTLGYTTPNGNVFLQPGLSRVEQLSTLRHESVHAFFSPKGSGPVATFRQNLGQWGYDNSQLLRFTEEAIAETYGSGSLLQGLRHPFVNGYNISGGGVLLEGAAVGGGLFGTGYWGYQQGGNGQ